MPVALLTPPTLFDHIYEQYIQLLPIKFGTFFKTEPLDSALSVNLDLDG